MLTRDIIWWRARRQQIRHPGRFPPTGFDRLLQKFVADTLGRDDWKVMAQDRQLWAVTASEWVICMTLFLQFFLQMCSRHVIYFPFPATADASITLVVCYGSRPVPLIRCVWRVLVLLGPQTGGVPLGRLLTAMPNRERERVFELAGHFLIFKRNLFQ